MSRSKRANRFERGPIPGLVVLILAGSMVACSESGYSPAIHDSKYAFIGANGESVERAEDARCVLDQFTGLIWERKDAAGGLHDKRHTYSWYKPDEKYDPEGLDYRGTVNGGECAGSTCDTHGFVKSVNEAGYCGAHDWRLPQRDELGTISDSRQVDNPPTVNLEYFPTTLDGEYWSDNDYSFQWDAAWVWNFHYGHDRVEWKKSPRPVRLVRGESFDPKLAGK